MIMLLDKSIQKIKPYLFTKDDKKINKKVVIPAILITLSAIWMLSSFSRSGDDSDNKEKFISTNDKVRMVEAEEEIRGEDSYPKEKDINQYKYHGSLDIDSLFKSNFDFRLANMKLEEMKKVLEKKLSRLNDKIKILAMNSNRNSGEDKDLRYYQQKMEVYEIKVDIIEKIIEENNRLSRKIINKIQSEYSLY